MRCQTDGLSAAQVVSHMWRQMAQPGGSRAVLRQLYSGIGATALFSIAVGAVHWLSFCAAKRAAVSALHERAEQERAASGARASTSAGAGVGAARQGHSRQDVPHPARGRAKGRQGGDGGGDGAAVGDESKGDNGRTGGRSRSGSKGRGKHSEGTDGSSSERAPSPELPTLMSANLIAAAAGAFATALVESPVELFRHQAQAGLISGNLVSGIATPALPHTYIKRTARSLLVTMCTHVLKWILEVHRAAGLWHDLYFSCGPHPAVSCMAAYLKCAMALSRAVTVYRT